MKPQFMCYPDFKNVRSLNVFVRTQFSALLLYLKSFIKLMVTESKNNRYHTTIGGYLLLIINTIKILKEEF